MEPWQEEVEGELELGGSKTRETAKAAALPAFTSSSSSIPSSPFSGKLVDGKEGRGRENLAAWLPVSRGEGEGEGNGNGTSQVRPPPLPLLLLGLPLFLRPPAFLQVFVCNIPPLEEGAGIDTKTGGKEKRVALVSFPRSRGGRNCLVGC